MERYPQSVGVYRLEPFDRIVIEELLEALRHRFGRAESAEFLARAHRIAAALPRPLVEFVDAFRAFETAPVLVVSGLPVDDDRLGATPLHWDAQPDPDSTSREEFFLVLLASLLGDVFGWSTLQDGRLIHNVVPIPGDENEQSGHGSRANLEWHSEDGFHPYRCDYLGLLSLRNWDRTPTTITSIERVKLTPQQKQVLSQPRFIIRSDDEHLKHVPAKSAYGRDALCSPAPSSVLFGDLSAPYLRIDPYFMTAVPGDRAALEALREIVAQLDAALEDLVLMPGDVAFIDNYRAGHGRRPFAPRYDGTDRWLKKLGVTRDLRRSRAARSRVDSRVLDPGVLPVGAGGGAPRADRRVRGRTFLVHV
jgi:Fe(II)/alpha-ketoglutarate-dependent arginine beta-hydroxylase